MLCFWLHLLPSCLPCVTGVCQTILEQLVPLSIVVSLLYRTSLGAAAVPGFHRNRHASLRLHMPDATCSKTDIIAHSIAEVCHIPTEVNLMRHHNVAPATFSPPVKPQTHITEQYVWFAAIRWLNNDFVTLRTYESREKGGFTGRNWCKYVVVIVF